ncbi:HEPN domain-containing protein [Pseudomonas sp. WPR_5_2]|uniref:HEPN domain-containing protein n=1 Tax=Pseudomonas sp. WPR_5_2 TaxID=1907371 RepID=UPI000EB27E8B|nr:HEPN domain-containing protein [Pseudomonas sp. WPR_5_2]RKS17080.1 HEPN domain-containing protein [Pseudomonas sp. WPR_5_2]
MEIIDEGFVRQMDDKLMAQDVKLHARPFQVAIEWMREKNITGDVFDKSTFEPLMVTYKRLYPSGDFSISALLTGGVALRDVMYPARVHVGYGQVTIDPLECIEIEREELELVFQHYPDQGWRALYGVCDLWGFGYGVDDLIRSGSPATDLLKNARSSVAATPRILSADLDLDAAVQTACLTAELAMKAALIHLGCTEERVRKLSHHLTKLADELIATKPASSDDRLRKACAKFPNYVETRYAPHGLTRLELMALAMRAQFVAADAIRRISQRNLAGTVEGQPEFPSRLEP